LLQLIQWAADGQAAFVKDVGIDYSRLEAVSRFLCKMLRRPSVLAILHNSRHTAIAPMEQTTHYGPLVALGFFVREHDLWSPIQSRLLFAHKTHTEHPIDALLDMCVGILAGCEVVSQINTTIRPDLLLASAWGRHRFAEQSTISRVLDACGAEQVGQMREANEALLKWTGQVHHHDFAQHWLRLDLDLTGLLASKLAEGSTKGYFAGNLTFAGK